MGHSTGQANLQNKGDALEVKNYRPIALICTLEKIYATILEKKLRRDLESSKTLSETQMGFRNLRSCLPVTAALCTTLARRKKEGKDTHVLFPDVEKAFDRVHRGAIWEALAKARVDAPLIKAIKLLYSDNSMSFITHHGLTKPVQTERGVRQSCPLSPTHFAMGIKQMLPDLTLRTEGVSVHGIKLNNLSFADDLALLAISTSDLRNLLELVTVSLGKVGLRLNASKCEYIARMERPSVVPKLVLEYEGQKHAIARHLGASRYLGIWISAASTGKQES